MTSWIGRMLFLPQREGRAGSVATPLELCESC